MDIRPTKLVRGQGLCCLIAENKEEEEKLPLALFVSLQDEWFTDVAHYLTYGECLEHLSAK